MRNDRDVSEKKKEVKKRIFREDEGKKTKERRNDKQESSWGKLVLQQLCDLRIYPDRSFIIIIILIIIITVSQ